MRPFRLALLVLVGILIAATSASADATAFFGVASQPVNRPSNGLAIGVGLLLVGFEFEYASSAEDLTEAAPALTTGMGNVLLQTPFPLAGLQFYATAGAGGYRERLAGRQETSVGVNTGGGVKIAVAGPVRVRLDYRVFRLRGDALHPTVQRVYAGVNIAF